MTMYLVDAQPRDNIQASVTAGACRGLAIFRPAANTTHYLMLVESLGWPTIQDERFGSREGNGRVSDTDSLISAPLGPP